MHTESDYDSCTAYCYPEQGMFERLLRVHMQTPERLWAWETLDYNSWPMQKASHSVYRFRKTVCWSHLCSP